MRLKALIATAALLASSAAYAITPCDPYPVNPPFSIDYGGLFLCVTNTALTGAWAYNHWGFVAKLQGIPDPNTGIIGTRTLSGLRVVAAGHNPRTQKVAAGVLMQYYAATDSSTVWVLDRRNGNRSQVKFIKAGETPPADGSSRPFRSIYNVYYTSEGYLNVVHGDASGSRALVRFNPNLSFKDCRYLQLYEGRRLCGE